MSKLTNIIEQVVMKYLAVPKLPSVEEGKIHIACIGDSITFGAGVNGKKESTWENHLEELLGEKYQVLNYGVSGRTLLSTGDYPYVLEKQYQHAKEIGADVYIIMLGTNDSKPYNWDAGQYKKELDGFVSDFLGISNTPRVILMAPPRCYEDPRLGAVAFDINEDIIANEIYSTVHEIGSLHGLSIIDLHSFTTDHEGWFADGVHPNEEGNKHIAEFIFKQAFS